MSNKIKIKRRMLNTIMVAAIVLIFGAGIMTVGSLQGWFDEDGAIEFTQPDGTVEAVTVEARNKIGSANIERKGIAYSLSDGTKLKDGDIIQTLNGTSIDIFIGKNTVSLDENSEVTVHVTDSGISFTLFGGGLFADIFEPLTLELMDTNIAVESGVFSANAPYGSASVYVYENMVKVGTHEVKAGNIASILADGIHTAALSIQSLNSFDLAKVTKVNDTKMLCFANAEIQQLALERQEAKKIAEDIRELEKVNAQAIEEQRRENEEKQDKIATGGSTGNKTTKTDDATGSNGTDDSKTDTGKTDERKKDDSKSNNSKTDNNNTDDGDNIDVVDSLKCTITIRCDTILDNMEDLTEGKNKYVPANGVILDTSKMSFEEGETVFDVLKRACSLAGIQLEYSWTPMYNSHYIEGINHLYEFDCGPESGWMYKVNGWFPNYGASVYTLKDGDVIVWTYTCKGLGVDVGGSVY